MRVRFLTVVLSSLLSVLVIGAAAGGVLYWKVMNGPISLNFLSDRIGAEISKSLGGLKVELADAAIEHNDETGRATVRLRNVRLVDGDGQTIANAPQALVSIESAPLLTGTIVPRSFELIGAKVEIRRSAAGAIELGFIDGSAGGGADPVAAESQKSSKSDRLDNEAKVAPPAAARQSKTPGSALIEILSGKGANSGALATLENIKVSSASVSLFDEANQSLWTAPNADLVFKRMPYGFAVAATAKIDTGREPWGAQISANYRSETRDFAISMQVQDLVPADIADNIYALSQLAQLRLPLSGTAEILVGENGRIASASGTFSAGAGRVSLPEFIAETILVDEGQLTADYNPATGGVKISKTSLLVGGSRADIDGSIDPVFAESGKVSALKIALTASDVSIDTQGNPRSALEIDRVVFAGTAFAGDQRLDIGKLEVTSGKSAVSISGSLEGGNASPGIRLEGQLTNVPASLLKKLWPPMIAPNTRKWVNANVKAGTVTEGSFKVNFAPEELAEAQKQRRLPDDAVDVRFSVANVTTTYFQDLPALQNAEGRGHVHGNTFDLSWTGGAVELPSGKIIKVPKGTMQATDLLGAVTPAVFDIDLTGQAQAGFEYIGLPALKLMKKSGFDASKLSGDATVTLGLGIPLQKDLPRDKVKVSLSGKLAGAAMKDADGDMDITGGAIEFAMKDGGISGEGPVKLNGIGAALSFTRKDGGGMAAVIETELDDKERLKIGADINEFVRGPVKVKVSIPDDDDGTRKLHVVADLSKAELRLDAISWSRPPGQKSTAEFDFVQVKGRAAQIKNLVIKSGEVALEGDIVLSKAGGIVEARLPKVYLDSENRFSVNLRRTEGEMTVSIEGKSFDARPLIKQMFASKTTAASQATAKGGLEFVIDANIDRVYANRGEVIVNMRGNLRTRGGSVLRADLEGNFLSGQPIALRIKPGKQGRCLRVHGRDAGAAIRSANLYSKIAGGQIELDINFAGGTGFVRAGKLVLRQFEVRNEAVLSQVDRRAKPSKSGPRSQGLAFRKVVLPFTTDSKFIRISEAYARGNELCAVAEGIIRKSDVAMDITGDIVPVCALNNVVGDIPLLNILFPNGLLGVKYALGGTMGKPSFQVNPLSALAPGFLREVFEYESSNTPKRSAIDAALASCSG